jgi:hypothetical protein
VIWQPDAVVIEEAAGLESQDEISLFPLLSTTMLDRAFITPLVVNELTFDHISGNGTVRRDRRWVDIGRRRG